MNIKIIIIGFILLIVLLILIDFFIGFNRYDRMVHLVFRKDPNIIDKIEKCLDKEKNELTIAELNVLLLWRKLLKDEDVSELIEKIDYSKIFLRNSNYEKNFKDNLEVLLHTLLCLPRLKKIKKLSVLKEKFNVLQGKFDNHVEYRIVVGAFAFLENNTKDSKILYDVADGKYSEYKYDKLLISTFKDICIAYIASLSNEKIYKYSLDLKTSADWYCEDLLTDLGIYELYK